MQPRATLLGLVVAALAAMPALAQEQPVGALDDFVTLCPAVLLGSQDEIGAAQQQQGLRFIDNAPLAFGWDVRTFLDRERVRGVRVTRMEFDDAERLICTAALPTQLRYDEVEALELRLEANPAIGPLGGKIYPLGTGVEATLKAAGRSPLVILGVSARSGVTFLSLDVWREPQP